LRRSSTSRTTTRTHFTNHSPPAQQMSTDEKHQRARNEQRRLENKRRRRRKAKLQASGKRKSRGESSGDDSDEVVGHVRQAAAGDASVIPTDQNAFTKLLHTSHRPRKVRRHKPSSSSSSKTARKKVRIAATSRLRKGARGGEYAERNIANSLIAENDKLKCRACNKIVSVEAASITNHIGSQTHQESLKIWKQSMSEQPQVNAMILRIAEAQLLPGAQLPAKVLRHRVDITKIMLKNG